MKRYLFVAIMLVLSTIVHAKKDDSSVRERTLSRTTVQTISTDEKTHHMGNLYLTVTNWGFFGSQRGNDNPYYCITDDEGICGQTGVCRPSGEYPGCSGIEYLFQGALWIGAVIAGDTLVSIGEDGWLSDVNELLPSYLPGDTLFLRSILDGDVGAISEQDYVGDLTDTILNTAWVDPSHRPIGIAIHQESYSWSYDYAKNFVIIDYAFTNIRQDEKTIEDMYIGIYIDGDCGHVDEPDYAQDDVTGFIREYVDQTTYPPDTNAVMLAWIADNDGDPGDNVYTDRSPTGAMAVRVLRGPWGTTIEPDTSSGLYFAFNWWISNVDETYDWGPARRDLGFDGTPMGDLNKYKIMSNKEFDYDQTAILDSGSSANWQGNPPPSDENWRKNIQNGYDTRFLLSFGPLTIEPAETVNVTIAFLVGEGFHANPRNTGSLWTPSDFRFDDLAYSAYWVSLVYDNPGVDTDTTDTIPPPPSDRGDGVPDYRGPAPPPAPMIFVERGEYKITVFWSGEGIEDSRDQITKLKDFEGYRIYVAEANLESYFVPLVQYDKVDFLRYSKMYRIPDDTAASGFRYHGVYSDSAVYDPNPYWVYVYSLGDTIPVDSMLMEPEPISYNFGMPPDTVIDGETYYYYVLENLLPGDDKYIVVTSFDYGQPSKNLGPLESSKTKYSKWFVTAGTSAKQKEVIVVPNPYRVDHDYSDFWEKSFTGEWSEYSRKLRFFNLPARCVVRIFTLDGDLVQTLHHDDAVAGEMVGAEDWNLISRNDQAISSGIYIFSVENLENGDIQIGKFVIIK